MGGHDGTEDVLASGASGQKPMEVQILLPAPLYPTLSCGPCRKVRDLFMSKTQNLRIIPLGGQEEVGRNMTVFEYRDDIVIVDMGIQFPEEDMPGIDYIIPNINCLKGKEKNIRAVVFTHGHLDHIGAAPILLQKLAYPIVVGREFTLALIKQRMEDAQKGSAKRLKTMLIKSVNENIRLGNIKLSFFQVEHSIIDSMGVVISTPIANVIHMGDWTLDIKSSKAIAYHSLAKLPRPSILMLESLGALNKQPLITETEMWNNLRTIINEAPGRIIIATFSTQIKRMCDIFAYAQQVGKKVAIEGYSMKMNFKTAKQLGYIKAGKDTFIDIKNLSDYPDNRVIILCTGAQGEGRAVLSRMVNNEHTYVKLGKNDTIIFSSSVIPGNERTIQRLKDSLYRKCDNVIHSEIMDIHTSGHNNIAAIQEVVRQIKPTYVLPVYANHYFLKEAKKVIEAINFPRDNIIILDNGHIVEFSGKNRPVIEKKKADSYYIMVDGLGVGDVGEVVLRDRQTLAKDGMFVIVAVVDRQTGTIRGSPDIISRGFVYLRESKQLLKETRQQVVKIVNKAIGSETAVNWSYVKNEIRNSIGQFLYTKTQRRPMILPVVIEV